LERDRRGIHAPSPPAPELIHISSGGRTRNDAVLATRCLRARKRPFAAPVAAIVAAMAALELSAAREQAELEEYLGERFELSRLQRYELELDREFAECGDERGSTAPPRPTSTTSPRSR
jgi:hypothetical protein